MNRRSVRFLGVCAAYALTPTSYARAQVLDEGTLMISIDGTVAAVERFVLRAGRGADKPGFTVQSTVSFPPNDPTRQLAAVIEFGADSQPVGAQFDLTGDAERRTLISLDARRITIRILSPQGGTLSQYRKEETVLLLTDSLLGSFLLAPRAASVRAVGVTPEGGLADPVTVEDRGLVPTQVGEDTRSLRFIRVGQPAGELHLWYDNRGRLIKASLPDRNLSAVRYDPDAG